MAMAENNVGSMSEARVMEQPRHYNLRLREANKPELQQAMALTINKPIADMHYDDRALLNTALFEKPQLLATSIRFHYVKMARLFKIPTEKIRAMENAEDVLNHINQTQEVELTVAELLEKLEGCGQCYGVVRELCKKIIQRGKET